MGAAVIEVMKHLFISKIHVDNHRRALIPSI